MRQERIRREHPASNAWRNDPTIQTATPEEYAASVEHENAERSATAYNNFEHLRSLDEIFIGKKVAERGRGNIADYCCMASYNGYECSCP